MKKNFLTILSLVTMSFVYGQRLPQDTSLFAYTNQTSIQALNSVTLKNGFHIPVQPAGRSVTISIARFQNIVSRPSSDRNYILTRTFRTPGVTMATLNAPRTISEENQNIQYFDGMGRPSQTVQLMASPGYRDIVQHIEYDGFGRESVKYLPHVKDTVKNGGFYALAKKDQLAYYASTNTWDAAVTKTANPYSVTVFENSPLNRVEQQGSPGAAWQPLSAGIPGSGHTIRKEYGTNVETEAELVKRWKVDYNGSGIPIGATGIEKYGAGKLFKTTLKDENWVSGKAGTVEEYKDFQDRIILKRIWETASKALDTYYVYDDFGGLCYVIPPAVTATSFTETAASFTGYIYAYRYDEQRRVVEKKIPGKGWEWIVYNVNNQIVMTQDALQRTKVTKEWSYMKYDAFGRVVSKGIYARNYTDRASAQKSADSTKVYWEDRTVQAKMVGQVKYTKYTNNTFPKTYGKITPLVVNYYDDYLFESSDTTGLAFSGTSKSDKLRGLLTGTRVFRDDGSKGMISIHYYDSYGRSIETVSQNQLSGTDRVINTYLFSGELKSSMREHKKNVTDPGVKILTTNEYDHIGRLIETKKRIGELPEVSQSKLSYNEIGQLKQKDLHTTGNVATQEIVYGYNERGWTKSINDPTAVTAKRVFGMQLKYADKVDSYNGNVSSMIWNTKTATPLPVQSYTYTYDKLNRLRKGAYRTANDKVGFYDEEIAYDNMGNIDTLRRKNGTNTSWYNHFKYTYSGNQSTKVTDIGTALRSNTFSYDVNGNGITNDRLGISKIEYNYLNLPVKLTKGAENLLLSYDANGKKLTKTLGSAVTQYIDGIQYQDGLLEFIQTEEGRIIPNGSNYIYQYFLEDHLGNTRAVVDHNGVLKQVQDYYPFGMEMNQGNALNTASNLYKYNGKEKQPELGLDQLDYGARFYDAEIGRWNVVDPLAEKFQSYSPYNYALNDPIGKFDPDGMAVERFIGGATYTGEDATRVFEELKASMGSSGDEQEDPPKKKNKGGYWSGFRRGTNSFNPFDKAGQTWTRWIGEGPGALLGDLGDASAGLIYTLGSLTYTQTYVDFYNNSMNYWNMSAEEKGYADGVGVNSLIEGGATYAPLSYLQVNSTFLKESGPTFAEYKAMRGGTETLGSIPTSTGRQRISTEFSHTFLTQRLQRRLGGNYNWLFHNRINIWKLNTIQHSIIDKYRFKFLRKGMKDDVGLFKKYNWFYKVNK